MMNNSDLARIINSDEIQTKVRAAREGFAKPSQKRNPLKNLGTMLKLNPYIAQVQPDLVAQMLTHRNPRACIGNPVMFFPPPSSVGTAAAIALRTALRPAPQAAAQILVFAGLCPCALVRDLR